MSQNKRNKDIELRTREAVEFTRPNPRSRRPYVPDVIGDRRGNRHLGERTWTSWFNTAAFIQAPFGRFGTSPRTSAIRLPGIANGDFSVNKTFTLSEQRRLEFRTEFFNLTNHFNPDPGTVDRNIRSKTFGAVGGGVQGVTTRVIQLGAKLLF